MASAVTGRPAALARRTSSTDPAVDRCRKWTGWPVRRQRARSRITISSSASAGWPGRPSRDDHSPSCMTPSPARARSSQCWATSTPRGRAYSIARRMSRLSCTPSPSSVNIRTPSAAISPYGARRSPRRPSVSAPTGATSADRRPGQLLHLADDGRRVDRRRGVGHGAHGREPTECGAAAAGLDGLGLLPPGWRRWAWRSTRPRDTTHPPASSTHAPAGGVDPDVDGHHRVALHQDVGTAATAAVHHLAAPDQDAPGGAVRRRPCARASELPSRSGKVDPGAEQVGTAPPSARPRRSRPGG